MHLPRGLQPAQQTRQTDRVDNPVASRRRPGVPSPRSDASDRGARTSDGGADAGDGGADAGDGRADAGGGRPAYDPGLFGPDSVTWRIHGDPSMIVAGFRALMLQAVHPLVMAGFDDNSLFRGDPWGRLQRTGDWVATVTYGSTEQAELAGARLRGVHRRLATGIEPESGQPYRVDDPELLRWVHVTEVESFLDAFRRSGGQLGPGDGDRYVEEMRASARLVGLDPGDVPRTEAEVAQYYRDIRPQLRVTAVARRNVLWGFAPPMPRWVALVTPARPAWAGLVTVAAAMLPRWARRLYGLPGLPTTDLAATVSARVVRATALSVPDRWRHSPAYRAALAGASAAADG